jgi:hypothetical protein
VINIRKKLPEIALGINNVLGNKGNQIIGRVITRGLLSWGMGIANITHKVRVLA